MTQSLGFIRNLSLQSDGIDNCIIHISEEEATGGEDIYMVMDFSTDVCWMAERKVEIERKIKEGKCQQGG